MDHLLQATVLLLLLSSNAYRSVTCASSAATSRKADLRCEAYDHRASPALRAVPRRLMDGNVPAGLSASCSSHSSEVEWHHITAEPDVQTLPVGAVALYFHVPLTRTLWTAAKSRISRVEHIALPHGTIDDKVLDEIVTEHLLSIDISFCHNLTDSGIAAALKKARALSRLEAFNTLIGDEAALALATQPNLEDVGLDLCDVMSDVGLKRVAAVPTLRRLAVSPMFVGSGGPTGIGLRDVVLSSRLQVLSLGGLVELRDQDLVELSAMKALRSLRLLGCDRLTSGVLKFTEDLKQLQVLHCSAALLTNTTLAGMAWRHEIRDFELRFEQRADMEAALREVLACEGVTSLSLDNGEATKKAIDAIHAMASLNTLSFWRVSGVPAGLQRILSKTGMTYVSFSHCPDLSKDQVVRAMLPGEGPETWFDGARVEPERDDEF